MRRFLLLVIVGIVAACDGDPTLPGTDAHIEGFVIVATALDSVHSVRIRMTESVFGDPKPGDTCTEQVDVIVQAGARVRVIEADGSVRPVTAAAITPGWNVSVWTTGNRTDGCPGRTGATWVVLNSVVPE